jgi:hypothetical protein
MILGDNMKSSIWLMSILLTFIGNSVTHAEYLSWNVIEQRFKEENLNTKALSHVKCFFTKHENTIFNKKMSFAIDAENRCAGNPIITIDSKRTFSLIDYTARSNEKRMFLVDRVTGQISSMAVAHGRFQAGMFNRQLSENNNSIKDARYFSNELGSNAPSSGFFVAGTEYEGKFGRSLVLHGLEHDANDNACERAVVIHKHLMVSKDQAYILSSGCPMVSVSYIDHVINLLKSSFDFENSVEKNGSVIFIYGPREYEWKENSCDGSFNI